MSGSGRRGLVFIGAALFCSLVLALPSSFGQQSQSPPPKKDTRKARKVWTNDDIPLLQQSRGVSIVGTAPAPAAETAPPAAGELTAAPQEQPQTEETYALMPMEERELVIAQLEKEIAELEEMLRGLRDRLYNARTEEEQRQLGAEVDRLVQVIEADNAEMEMIRSAPPPAPPKPSAETKPSGSSSSAPPPPSSPPPSR